MVETTCTFPSDLRQLAAMRSFLKDACRRAWAVASDDEVLGQLELAMYEAATNIIRHAYEGQSGKPIYLTIEADDASARVTLAHHGCAFQPESVPEPSFDGSRFGGFGVYMIEKLVDEVQYTRDEAGRTAIRLFKSRTPTHTVEVPCDPEPGPKEAQTMQLTVETVQNVAVVKIHAEQLDASNADDFKREIAPVLAANPRMVLDLGLLQFVDSSGCGAILSCLKTLTGAGGDLKLCGVTRPVRNVFELIRLHRICEIFDARETAVASFSKAK